MGDVMNDAEFSAFIEDLRKGMNELKQISTSVNPDRARDVSDVYNLMKYLLQNNVNAKVTYEICKDSYNAASVTVIADKISLDEPYLLARAAAIANNFNVYPVTNGGIRMDFLFINMLTLD